MTDVTVYDTDAIDSARRERRLFAIHIAESLAALFGPMLFIALVIVYALYRGYETSPPRERAPAAHVTPAGATP
jgi:hypothetical protein